MHKYTILLLFIMIIGSAEGQSHKERKQLFESTSNYEIEMLGVGQDGTKVFKIWAYGKKPEEAILQGKKLAVRACLFRGLPGSRQVIATPPICTPSAETEHSDFFDHFFETGGSYLNYVNITSDGMPGGQDRLKVKKGYKMGLKVQILYDNLRKYMEQAGMARRMDTLF